MPDRVDVLARSKIRFTQPSALNDPFELRPLFSQLVSDEMLEERLHPSSPSLQAELSTALADEYAKLPLEQKRRMSFRQLTDLLKRNPELVQKALHQVLPSVKATLKSFTPKAKEMLTTVLQSQIGILSLSSEVTNPLLWSHYSGNGRGFAYELDPLNPFFDKRRSKEDEFFHLRQVRYISQERESRSLVDLDGDDVLVTKGEVWAHEKEWRILAPLDTANKKIIVNGEDIYLFDIPPSAFVSIVLGAKADPRLVIAIKDVLRDRADLSHITLAKAEANLESHQIEIVPIEI